MEGLLMKKWICMLLLLTMLFAITGCATDSPVEETESEEPVAEEVKVHKVALLMDGPINDMGWNAMAYGGLMKIDEEFDNVETSFMENIAKSDYEDIFIGFAVQGFDLVIAHGYQFNDVATKVSEAYPDTQFAIISGVGNGSNLTSFVTDSAQEGFLAGLIAGMMTETNVVGGIGGVDFPAISDVVKGYGAGAKYVNPDVEYILAMTGSFEDANLCKEVTLSMIDNDVDIMMGVANQANLGIIEAAKEHSIYYVGVNADMSDNAPETVLNTAYIDGEIMFVRLYEEYLAGTLDGGNRLIGLNQGALYLGEWNEQAAELTNEMSNQLDELIQDVRDGSIDYLGLTSAVAIN
jgi:basic membrane protein A